MVNSSKDFHKELKRDFNKEHKRYISVPKKRLSPEIQKTTGQKPKIKKIKKVKLPEPLAISFDPENVRKPAIVTKELFE